MKRISHAILVSAAAGAILTLVTGLLATFGGAVGVVGARVLGFPAVLWSNAAYALGLHPLTNALLADPGGLYCFASGGRRFLSHIVSAMPAFTLVAALVVFTLSLWRRSRGRRPFSGAPSSQSTSHT